MKKLIYAILFISILFTVSCKKDGVSPDKAKIISIKASSTLKDKNNKYKAQNLIDKDLNTIWAEGASSYGKGETITITFDKLVKLTGFYIQNGLNHKIHYKSNGRVKEFLVNGKLVVSVEDSGVDNFSWVKFKEPVNTTVLKLKIKNIYPGTRWKDTCITEIAFARNVQTGYKERKKAPPVWITGTYTAKKYDDKTQTYIPFSGPNFNIDDITLLNNGKFIWKYGYYETTTQTKSLLLNGEYTVEPGQMKMTYKATMDQGEQFYDRPEPGFILKLKFNDPDKFKKFLKVSPMQIIESSMPYLKNYKKDSNEIWFFILKNRRNILIPPFNNGPGAPDLYLRGSAIGYYYIK